MRPSCMTESAQPGESGLFHSANMASTLAARSCAQAGPRTSAARRSARSTMPNDENISIFDNVLLAFQAQQPLLADTGISAQIDQRLPVDHFRTNELLLKVG